MLNNPALSQPSAAADQALDRLNPTPVEPTATTAHLNTTHSDAFSPPAWGARCGLAVLLNPFCPFSAGKVLAAGGAAVYATQQRRPAAA